MSRELLRSIWDGFVVGFIVGFALFMLYFMSPPYSPESFVVKHTRVKVVERLEPSYLECYNDSNGCRKLAEALVYEARGEGRIGMRAVAYVVLARVEANGWPSTVWGVITQRRQFSYLQDMHRQKSPTEEDFQIAYEEALRAYRGMSRNPVPGALWYHSNSIKPPKWTKSLEELRLCLGDHIFYKEKS